MLSAISRFLACCTLLTVVACSSGDYSHKTEMPIPSAARGGVLPPGETTQPMRHAAAPVAAPAPAAQETSPAAAAPTVQPQASELSKEQPVVTPAAAEAIPAVPAPSPPDALPQMHEVAYAPAVPPDAVAPAPMAAPTTPVVAVTNPGPAAGAALPASAAAASESAPPMGGFGADYILGTGDEIRLIVYGEEDLSGQYLVGSTGIVALPLIGNINAAGHTVGQFEAAVRAKLSAGYVKDPRVSAQVINYRPFYIIGEVAKPGSYPYVNGMIVLNAVALAGGYTYRADAGDIRVVHASDPAKKERDIEQNEQVMPGDIIRVTERFF